MQIYLKSMAKQCCDVRIKVVFTDIQMPVMDGITASKKIFEHCRRMREVDPELPKIRIAAVSAYNDEETKLRCVEVGITNYLTKPVSQRMLK